MKRIGTAISALPMTHRALLSALAVVLFLAQIDQPYPELAPLQHGPTLVFLIVSPWLLRRWPLSVASFTQLILFLLLHTIGGRYIYSYVPYDEWSSALFGTSISGALGLERNGWDRLVHFAFGLLLTSPMAELAHRNGRISRRLAVLIAILLVGFLSAAYEVFEWGLTLLLAGETADYYNGQQGDLWDPQKDMALAMAGSFIAGLIAAQPVRRFRNAG